MSAALAALPRLDALEEHGPRVGFITHKSGGPSFPVYSDNPRRYVDSRRRWANDTAYKVGLASRRGTALVTLTLPAEFHRALDWSVIECEARGVRRLLQRLARFVVRAEAGDACWQCIGAWLERLAAKPRAPFRPCRKHSARWRTIGNCAGCASWQPTHYYGEAVDDRTGELRPASWLCRSCARGRERAQPRLRFWWVREPGASLQHLHRHGVFDGPYVPQRLWSALAAAAGLGRVVDVRRLRDREADSAPLGDYLRKTASTPLGAYAAKLASEPDAFCALPERECVRVQRDGRRVPYSRSAGRRRLPASAPTAPSEWRFTVYDPTGAQGSWSEPNIPRASLSTIAGERRADSSMLSAPKQAVPRGKRGAMSEACGAREAATPLNGAAELPPLPAWRLSSLNSLTERKNASLRPRGKQDEFPFPRPPRPPPRPLDG